MNDEILRDNYSLIDLFYIFKLLPKVSAVGASVYRSMYVAYLPADKRIRII